MSKWTTLLDQYINFETSARKSTDETDETHTEHVDETRKITKPDSFVSFDSDFSGPRFENTQDAETIIERAAIQEYDGDLLRDQVNMEASAAYDRNRQSYEQANPGRDPRNVEALYRAYIARWQPDRKGDLPATPPNTRGNAELWRAWWKKVEGQNHG